MVISIDKGIISQDSTSFYSKNSQIIRYKNNVLQKQKYV